MRKSIFSVLIGVWVIAAVWFVIYIVGYING